jgi:cell filamentation protein
LVRAIDPYLQPNGTLKNKLGIAEAEELARAEDQLVTIRQAIVARHGVRSPFTVQTLRTLHFELFQDIYDWAGDFRACNLKKETVIGSGEYSEFATFPTIEARCAALLTDLSGKSFLNGLGDFTFCDLAADAFARLNSIHPFREGNGRVQRLFFTLLARNADRDLAFDVITHERMVDVSVRSHRGDLQSMKRLFQEMAISDRRLAIRRLIGFLKREKFAWNDVYIATTVAGQTYSGILAGVAEPDFILRVADGHHDWIAAGHTDDLATDHDVGEPVDFVASRY